MKEFDVEFRDYFKDKSADKKQKKVTTDSVEFDIPEKDVNTVFKKIAQKTHPDKLINEDTLSSTYKEKVDMYKEALGSVENKDWSRVIEIAMELDIDVSGFSSGIYHVVYKNTHSAVFKKLQILK